MDWRAYAPTAKVQLRYPVFESFDDYDLDENLLRGCVYPIFYHFITLMIFYQT